MADTAKNISSENCIPPEEWTIVLPRRGKKKRCFRNSGVLIQRQEEQPWTPTDTEEDPERESKLMQKMHIYLQKLEVSDFFSFFLEQMQNPDMLNRFLKVLGSEQKMQMVIYGIGSIESFEPPRFQLSLAVLIKRKFDWIGEIEVFDPIISLTESKVLNSLGCSVLSVNEQGRRQVQKPTLFFMSHCEANLYENLLAVNWAVGRLDRMVLFGNSFGSYEQHMSLCQNPAVSNSRKHILAVRNFSHEVMIKTFSDDYFRAFHGSSWHFFSPVTEDETFGNVVKRSSNYQHQDFDDSAFTCSMAVVASYLDAFSTASKQEGRNRYERIRALQSFCRGLYWRVEKQMCYNPIY